MAHYARTKLQEKSRARRLLLCPIRVVEGVATMRRLVFAAFATSLGSMVAGAVGACSSDDIDEGGPAFDSGSGTSGVGAAWSGSSNGSGPGSSSASTGSYGAGGGGGFNRGPRLPPGPDAGPDADTPVDCAMLDSSKPMVLYLSADDSNSMGSPVYARELLNQGIAPAGGIRTYEFLNYYRIAYPAPAPGSLSLVPQLQAGANPGELDMQIGVRSWDATKPRRPNTVTFVLDTSGSMGGAGIERERAAVKAIAASLVTGDIVSMVTWNTANLIVLDGHSVSGPNDPVLLQAADALSADGGTDLHSGLLKGYDLALQHYGSARMNRLVLITDGGANVGITDEDLIALNSEDADQEGIYLVGVGTGPAAGYNDLLMDVVTDRGRGAYVYLDDPAEATRMFVDRFDETMEIAARGVQIEMTMPWYFQMHKFYGEEYSTDPTQVQPQHLAPSDAMIFNQIVKACDPAVVNGQDTIQVKATWEMPITYAKQETTVAITVDDLLAGDVTQLQKGKAIVAYAEALKTGAHDDLHAAHALALTVQAGGNDPELAEILSLIEKHPAY